jgi:tripartite-type tricarboxylate transporter receptor subunit TctC
MKRFVLALAAIAFAALAPQGAGAQSYPAKQVRIVVPFPPGGATDVLARDLGHHLGGKLGATVLVDNRAGASGTIGSDHVVKSPADGSVLLLTATHHVINPSLYKQLPYDTKRDFTSVALVASVANALIVHPSVPAKTVQELIALAKREPGKLSFGSAGIGGANHLSGELFKYMTGIDIVHVPYKGAAPAMTDLLGGHIPMMFDSLPTVLSHVREGRLRALGVTSKERSSSLPDVPTIDEAGVKGFEATAWFGLYAPANLKPEARQPLEKAVAEILASAEIRESFGKLGADPGKLTGSAFEQFVHAEMKKWGDVVERAQIKLD